jgi:hypothetical protein
VARSLAWQARFDPQSTGSIFGSLWLQGEPAASAKGVPTKRLLGVAVIASVVSLVAVERLSISRATAGAGAANTVRVQLQPRVIEYGHARVAVSGITATSVSARLLDANDPAGVAYRWSPYRWRRLELARGRWSGVLSAPPLLGIYQVQFRIQQPGRLLRSPHWLLWVLPPGTLDRRAFTTPLAAIRNYVTTLPGDQVLAAERPWPQAAYDHRDPRLLRLFVIAYAPQDDNTPGAQRGLFITTFRDGYHGRWRLLEATVSPPD